MSICTRVDPVTADQSPRGAVPVIDLTPFRGNVRSARLAVAREVAQACETIGFFTVVGHGVSERLIKQCRAAAREFFELPLDEKLRTPREAPAFNRGYGRVGGEALGKSLGVDSEPDLKESFSVGLSDVPDSPYYHAAEAFPHFAPNLWPRTPSQLRPLLQEYYQCLDALASDLMRVFALALELDEQFFADKIDRNCSSLRLINYPPQRESPASGQLRAGAHTDYGSLTILQTEDAPGGLQVRTRDGQWCDVVPPADGFVINIGDLMMHWTNDRWMSNLHRVVNPPLGEGAPRLSMVFFHQPNYDALIECLPGCQWPGNPPRHPPISSGEHRLLKLGRANA
jgi:isopenicillin N synthase-like dioxygenase